MNGKIKVGSDFSGVGAFNQALKRLGIDYEELFACDMDKYVRQTFCLNYGNENDVVLSKIDALGKTTVNPKDYSFYFPKDVYEREIPTESLDIYMTSPPCQAFSLAGKRLGKDDKRGILFFNSLEFIQKNNPRYFIFENVKGLLSDDKKDPKHTYGATFQEWINCLGGKSVNGVHTFFPYEDSVPYHIYFQVLNAKHYGIPQNRERIFIIGIRDDEDNDFQFPKPIPLEKRLKDVLESEVDEKYFLSDNALNHLVTHKEKHDEKGTGFGVELKDENSIASTLRANAALCPTDNHIKVSQTELNQVGSLYENNADAGRVYETNSISCTLKSGGGGGAKTGLYLVDSEPKILGYTRDEKGKVTSRHEQEYANTIHTSTGGGGSTDQFVKIGAIRGRNPQNPKSRESGLATEQMLEINENGTSNALTTVQKDNVVIIQANTQKGYEKAEEEDSINFSVPNSTTRRGRVGKKVSQTLDTQCNQGIATRKPSKQELEKIEVFTKIIPEIVNVRKYDVDIKGLQNLLKESKGKKTISFIADRMELPKTKVEHWFRFDKSFSIPDQFNWKRLKELLDIQEDCFDESILTFEEKESVFEKSNRVYEDRGLSPTLTATSSDERIFTKQRIRRLTPLECFRLMDFNFGIPNVKDFVWDVSDSQAYKQAGNSICVGVLAAIIKNLKL